MYSDQLSLKVDEKQEFKSFLNGSSEGDAIVLSKIYEKGIRSEYCQRNNEDHQFIEASLDFNF